MALDCKEIDVIVGCLTHADGSQQPVVIHYEYRNAANGNTVLHATRYTDALGAPITPAATDVVTPGACPVLVANPVHWCDGTKCVEGKAWYNAGTGVLVKFTSLNGDVVVPTSDVLEGACIPTIKDRPICALMTSGETWNVIERVTMDPCGNVTVAYFDPDVSPMKDVTADFKVMLHAGECDCCAPTL